jgi:hypothetical protein
MRVWESVTPTCGCEACIERRAAEAAQLARDSAAWQATIARQVKS